MADFRHHRRLSPNLFSPDPPDYCYLPPSIASSLSPPPSSAAPISFPPPPPPSSAASAAADVDILLAQSGYTVKASDLPRLAERIQHLETLLGSHDAPDLPSFSSEAVLYNPSDMVNWLDSLIGEFAPSQAPPPPSSAGFATIPSDAFDPLATGGYLWDSATPDPVEFLDYSGGWILPSHEGGGGGGADENLGCFAALEDRVSSSSTRQLVAPPPPLQFPPPLPAQIEPPPARRRRYAHQPPPPPPNLSAEMVTVPDAAAAADNFDLHLHREVIRAAAYQQAPLSGGVGRSKQPAVRRRQTPPKALSPSTASSGGAACVADPYVSVVDVKAAAKKKRKSGCGEGPAIIGGDAEVQQEIERNTAQKAAVGGIPRRGVAVGSEGEAISGIPAVVSGGDCKKAAEDAGGDAGGDDDDDDESGVTLVHLLMACADAIQKKEMSVASEMVRDIDRLAAANRGAMGRVAKHFVAALDKRIGGGAAAAAAVAVAEAALPPDPSDLAYAHFYDAAPYLKFSHFMANQAILEAFEGETEVHVIDFNLMQGSQWPPLIHALAVRSGGPPKLRITGIGPPPPPPPPPAAAEGEGGGVGAAAAPGMLEEVGRKLAEVAKLCGVDFSFRPVVAAKLEDLVAKPALLEVRKGEAVAVNAVFQLHRLLHSSAAPLRRLLAFVRRLSPAVLTVVEQHANHNNPIFLERFVEALHYYCTMFDSLDAAAAAAAAADSSPSAAASADLLAYAEHYLGREIVNIVACEGAQRMERHEPLQKWRQILSEAGFRPRHLGSNAFKQASMLVNWCSGDGYAVQENGGCLTLGWHSWPLIAASAWKCAAG